MTPKFVSEVFLTPLPALRTTFLPELLHLAMMWVFVPSLIASFYPMFSWYPRDACYFLEKKKKRKSGSEWERRMGGVEDWREGRIQMECIVWDVWEKKTQKRKKLKWNKITKMIIKFINESGFHYSVFIFFLNWKR